MGSVDIEVDAYDHSGVNSVEFFINEEPMFGDNIEPYNWTWDEICFGKFIIKAVVYDNAGNQNSEEIEVWKFCQIACPHHQSNRLVACSANFVSLGGHAPHGNKVRLSVLILWDAKSSRCD